MGAANTREYGIGKDAQTAYNNAVSQALHEYGHDPYSGTIGAKAGGFVLVSLPPRMTLDKFENLLMEYEVVGAVEQAKEDVRWAEKFVREAKPGHVRAAKKRLTEAKRYLVRAEREAAQFQRKLAKSGISEYDFARWYGQWTDKWEAPLCIELRGAAAKRVRDWQRVKRGKVYAFLGMAPT